MRWLKFIAKLIGRGIGYGGLLWLWQGFCYMLGSLNWEIVGVLCIVMVMAIAAAYIVFGVIGFVGWAFEPPLLDEKK